MKKEELQISIKLSRWLLKEHPSEIWRYDLADLKLPIGVASRNKDLNPHRGYPDLFLARATEKYSGLYIEVKKDRGEVYRKDGKIRQNEHIQEQDYMLRILRAKGYAAEFGLGLEHCKELITNYLNKQEIKCEN